MSTVAYLLALVASNLSHDHVHALAEADPAHACATADGDNVDHRGHGDDHDATLAGRCHEPAGVPTSDDDCSICRFLGRPIQLVTLCELPEVSGQVTPLASSQAPAVELVVLVVTQARAPPCVAQSV